MVVVKGVCMRMKFDNYLQVTIIKILLSNQFPITSYSIGQALRQSSQNIRKEIKNINRVLAKYDLQILSLPGVGNVLDITGHPAEKVIRESIFDALVYDKKITTDNFSREQLIIRYLVMSGKKTTVAELMEYFYVSRTTLYRDLERAAETMQNAYCLQLEIIPYHGISVEGSEISRRMILGRDFAFYKEDSLLYELCDDLDVTPMDAEVLLEMIQEGLGYSVSSNELYGLYIHLYIMMSRIRTGNTISDVDLQTLHLVTASQQEQFAYFIQEHFPDYKISIHEINYYILLVKSFGRNPSIIIGEDDALQRTINKGVNKLEQLFALDFSVVKQSKFFYQEIDALLTRTQNKFISSNLNEKKIKRYAPFYLELAFQFIQTIQKDYLIYATELDYCSIALCLYNLLDVTEQYTKRKVLTISSYSHGRSMRLLDSLEKGFPTLAFDYCDASIQKNNLDAYFFVISDTYMDAKQVSIPEIKINHFPSPGDHEKITNTYKSERSKKIQKMIQQRECVDFKTKEDCFVYILKGLAKEKLDEKITALVAREASFSFEVKKSTVIIYLFDTPSVKSGIYELENPLFWRYTKIKYVFVINCEDESLLFLNEWDILYRDIDTYLKE